MYEKLNVERADRFKKQQNPHRGGKVSLEFGAIFSLSSLVSRTSIWISSWGRMAFISVSPSSPGPLVPPSTFPASIIGPHSGDRFPGQRLASSSGPWRWSPPRVRPCLRLVQTDTNVCGSWPESPTRVLDSHLTKANNRQEGRVSSRAKQMDEPSGWGLEPPPPTPPLPQPVEVACGSGSQATEFFD